MGKRVRNNIIYTGNTTATPVYQLGDSKPIYLIDDAESSLYRCPGRCTRGDVNVVCCVEPGRYVVSCGVCGASITVSGLPLGDHTARVAALFSSLTAADKVTEEMANEWFEVQRQLEELRAAMQEAESWAGLAQKLLAKKMVER